MLEHSVYSVISPEGCASILWKDAEKMREAAEALRLTAQDLIKLGVADQIIGEPLGGAHRAPDVTMAAVGEAASAMLRDLEGLSRKKLIKDRREKYPQDGRSGAGGVRAGLPTPLPIVQSGDPAPMTICLG